MFSGVIFNQLSFDLLDSDAIGFGQQALHLIEALTDGEAAGRAMTSRANIGLLQARLESCIAYEPR